MEDGVWKKKYVEHIVKTFVATMLEDWDKYQPKSMR